MIVVTWIYYLLVVFVAALLVANLVRSRRWDQDVLYVLVLVPLILRLLRLK